MMDRIFIENLRLLGKHGVHADERRVEQEFLVDIQVEFDTRPGATSDDLSETLDYTRFAGIAEEAVAKNSFSLIERLAETIASNILEDPRIKVVEITIRKPAALANGVPGIAISRGR